MTSERTPRPPRTPTDDEIPGLLEALAASGGNTAAFARENGLAPWKLYEAQRVARGSSGRRTRKRADLDLVRVDVVEQDTTPPAPLELVLGSGHRLLIPVGFDEATLRRVMGVVSSC
ncbi:MAG: hypothetical protein ACE5HV_16950 [Acidobacteriota bacterium]